MQAGFQYGEQPQPGFVPGRPVSGSSPILRIAYQGTGGSFFVLVAKNLLLTLVTLGIYLPWARTERRKYLWQNLDVGGHRLRYHGTGRELLMGYLKVVAGYALFFGPPLIIRQFNPRLSMIVQAISFLALLLVIPIVIYGARRYQLSRTSLRNVRFGMVPAASGFWKEFMKGYLLMVITLGIYGPVFQNRVYAFLLRHTRYGTEAFEYDGKNREAFRLAFWGLLLSVVTLGIYLPWYSASMARFRVEHTTFQGARGRLELTGGDMFVIFLISTFGTVLSLGIAFPWVTTYVMRTIASKTSFVGDIDFGRVVRQASGGNAAADGFADALDVGFEV